MIPPIVHWQSSSTSIKPNISNCSRCLSQDWLRCGQVLFYVYLQGIVLSQSLIRNPLFYKPCSFQGQRFWILRIFLPPVFLLTASVSFRRQITKVKTFPLTENIFFLWTVIFYPPFKYCYFLQKKCLIQWTHHWTHKWKLGFFWMFSLFSVINIRIPTDCVEIL